MKHPLFCIMQPIQLLCTSYMVLSSPEMPRITIIQTCIVIIHTVSSSLRSHTPVQILFTRQRKCQSVKVKLEVGTPRLLGLYLTHNSCWTLL